MIELLNLIMPIISICICIWLILLKLKDYVSILRAKNHARVTDFSREPLRSRSLPTLEMAFYHNEAESGEGHESFSPLIEYKELEAIELDCETVPTEEVLELFEDGQKTKKFRVNRKNLA